MNNTYKNIDEYIAVFPDSVQLVLKKIRKIIQEAAPQASETISYQMPTYKLNGKNLVHFAGWKNHIGLYPTPSATNAFSEKLTKYKYAKGSIKFPLNETIPYSLIKEIVRFRIEETQKNET